MFKKLFSGSSKAISERRYVSTRTTRPAHFLFKIDSFTKLDQVLNRNVGSTADVKNYETPEFECSGHKWTLSLYPSGNKKLGGDGYISMYLVNVEAENDSLGDDGICAMFKLFIFDQKQESYLTIQDNEVRKFHSLKKEWGFTRLISLKAFKSVKNGYLVDDCCVFGVEILVIPREVKTASFSLIKAPSGGTFVWKIDNVSSMIDHNHYSAPFTVLDCQWKLALHQNGSKQASGHPYLYLVLHESNESSKYYVEYSLKIKDNILGRWGSVNTNCGWTGRNHALCIWNGAWIPNKETLEIQVTINTISKIITT